MRTFFRVKTFLMQCSTLVDIMFYHAMRASSVAMCTTWVWAMSVLLRGLPPLFLSVSLLYVPEGFLKFWVLTVYVFRKGSRWFGVSKQHVDMFVKP